MYSEFELDLIIDEILRKANVLPQIDSNGKEVEIIEISNLEDQRSNPFDDLIFEDINMDSNIQKYLQERNSRIMRGKRRKENILHNRRVRQIRIKNKSQNDLTKSEWEKLCWSGKKDQSARQAKLEERILDALIEYQNS